MVHHIIARFVNREFRMAGLVERTEYLRRMVKALPRTDWTLLAFALMSSHVHLVALAGRDMMARLAQSVHTGFALWLNRREGRLGPVFSERPTTVVVPDERVAALLAYVHNNPVRAGVVSSPEETTWTSHRYYVGLEAAPEWLAVERGLELAGCTPDMPGRASFHELVLSRVRDPRDSSLSGDLLRTREHIRRRLASPVELSSPIAGADGTSVVVLARENSLVREPWDGSPAVLVAAACRQLAVPLDDLQSRRRTRAVSEARRVCVAAWTRKLCRPLGEIADVLGIGKSAASQLLGAANASDLAEAEILADGLRK
jgi:REP element-mobilizing transposase RayT